MKLITPVIVTVFMCTAVAVAQNPTPYQVDNFDFASAVKVEVPAPAVPKRARKITSSSNLIYTPSTAPLIQPTSLNFSNGLEGFTTGDENVDAFIVESGKRNSVDPLLLYAVMHQESTFKRNAISPKGARGLMQLMPGTAARFGVRNIFDPKQNIEGGARYMRFLLDTFDGDIPLTLAGYNAGEGAVMRYGYNIPPYSETQEYVRRIAKRYSLIRDPLAAQNANLMSPDQVAAMQKKAPLTIYEPSVFAVRL